MPSEPPPAYDWNPNQDGNYSNFQSINYENGIPKPRGYYPTVLPPTVPPGGIEAPDCSPSPSYPFPIQTLQVHPDQGFYLSPYPYPYPPGSQYPHPPGPPYPHGVPICEDYRPSTLTPYGGRYREPPPPYEIAIGHPCFQFSAGSSARRDSIILPPTVPPGGIELPITHPLAGPNPKFRNTEPGVPQLPQYPIGPLCRTPNGGRYYVNRNEYLEHVTKMPYCNPMEPLLDSDDSKMAQTSFTNKSYQAFPGITGYLNPHGHQEDDSPVNDPPSVEDAFYETDDSEAELAAVYNELDGNCQDPFPSPRLLENQRKRLANRFKGNEKLNVLLVQLPDETCMLRCMTGTIIGTLAVIILIIVLYCMRIRENTGLPLEVDEFEPPESAADIVGLGTGL
ncbi:hypothetical protein FO519_004592 [Halicephalobus sp. NKZ332]|nr:hypothetical protein FO519_004592 [Halicephalobus sp. NKZ332]